MLSPSIVILVILTPIIMAKIKVKTTVITPSALESKIFSSK